MRKFVRIGALALLGTLLAITAMPASAQMMHYNLDVLVVLNADEVMTGGTVCVSGEVDDICQDIAQGTGSGEIYSFTGLGSGDHTVTVNGDPYLEAVDYATLEDETTEITINLYMEEYPVLPNTGSGSTSQSSSFAVVAVSALAVIAAGYALRRSSAASR